MRRKLRDTPLTPEEASFLASCAGSLPANFPGPADGMPGLPIGALPGCQDFGPILELADALSGWSQPAVRAFAGAVYRALYRCAALIVAALSPGNAAWALAPAAAKPECSSSCLFALCKAAGSCIRMLHAEDASEKAAVPVCAGAD